jgi:acyl carrier protein
MQDRIIAVLAAVLNVPAEQLGPDASPRTVSQWDSLKHMNLVLALEDEFGVQFSDQEIGELTSVNAIANALRALGAQ